MDDTNFGVEALGINPSFFARSSKASRRCCNTWFCCCRVAIALVSPLDWACTAIPPLATRPTRSLAAFRRLVFIRGEVLWVRFFMLVLVPLGSFKIFPCGNGQLLGV